MSNGNLIIGLVRRGYSGSGGAEAYLKRLARGLVDLGHKTLLFTTSEWPESEWPFGEIKYLRSGSALGFARELEELRRQIYCDVLLSLERVCSCDVYRAGDGVHQTWLDRRAKFENPLQRLARRFSHKHHDLLSLEKSLFQDRTADRVIVNSKMVKDEIVDLYNYRPDRIDLVRNGVPLDQFRFEPAVREKTRTNLGLAANELAVLFVGSGWERKGLRFAVEAVESQPNRKMSLFVAGRGNQNRFPSARTQFLGEIDQVVPMYAAADLFILPTIYDPFSNACLEALACGLPVITTRANGFSEVIEDKIHGSIIDRANDVGALRQALELWSDATRRSAARSAILKRASQFDISKNVAETIAILIQTAAEAAAKSGKILKT